MSNPCIYCDNLADHGDVCAACIAAQMDVLDLFSAAAGGWSLGMHRAGFRTVAACEAVEWRRILYAQNNPGVLIYDDVRTLTAKRLLDDLGRLPSVVVGSPPCQDISSANTKGKGVEGERSGLFFEAIRIIGEVRPRWFALENSHNLRTRGADAVLAALEALDYACWPLVVRAGDIGANHERPRCWLIGCDLEQVAHADLYGEHAQSQHGEMAVLSRVGRDCSRGQSANPDEDALRQSELPRGAEQEAPITREFDQAWLARNTADPDQAGQADGRMESGLRQAQIANHGCGDGRGDDRQSLGQMAIRPPDSRDIATGGPLWSLDDLAGRLWLDDGLPARVAGTRVAVGGPRGTVASSLIVEAYGDAVVPQIPEAIGRAFLRVEDAMRAIAARGAAS